MDKSIEHKLLGQILLESSIVSEAELAQALNIQRQDKRKLGQILLDLGCVNKVVVAL